jgi:hypothetical protein
MMCRFSTKIKKNQKPTKNTEIFLGKNFKNLLFIDVYYIRYKNLFSKTVIE